MTDEASRRETAPVIGARRSHRWLRLRELVGFTLALVALLLFAAPAFAESATISVTNTSGQSDPAAYLPRVFTVSGTSSVEDGLYIKYRAPGGAPCAPTAASDSGQWFDGYEPYGGRGDVNGSFSESDTLTWQKPGSWTFCIWLVHGDSETIATPITQTIDFRSPTGTITASVSPLVPMTNQETTITVSGASEAPEHVYAKVRRTGGAPCAPTFDADSGDELIEGTAVNGSFSIQATTKQSTPGEYLICLWLASSREDTSPIAGPQPETFTVTAPPPPCVVPAFSARTALSTLEQLLVTSHCTTGQISYVTNASTPRDDVVSLSQTAGTTLGSGAAVNVTVSAGRPCIVPRIGPNLSLRVVEHRLAAAHCTVGKISYTPSTRHRRGTVIKLTPGTHATLPAEAAVRILLSNGRHRH